MISVSLRTLLLYNLGFAAIFAVIGALSTFSLDLAHPARAKESEKLGQQARAAIAQEHDLEALRAKALYHFDLVRGMRQARARDTEETYADVRMLAFGVAGLFILGAVLALLLPSLPPLAPKPARAPG